MARSITQGSAGRSQEQAVQGWKIHSDVLGTRHSPIIRFLLWASLRRIVADRIQRDVQRSKQDKVRHRGWDQRRAREHCLQTLSNQLFEGFQLLTAPSPSSFSGDLLRMLSRAIEDLNHLANAFGALV